MKYRMKKAVSMLVLFALLTAGIFFTAVPARADLTDELLNFTITVDVNPDASLTMDYYIEWKVLDDSIGALEWIDLGVPNRYHSEITAISDSISSIEDNGNSLAIYLDRSYYEGDVATVEFSMVQDHMYTIDKWVEGETVYTFTPAWFDSLNIDELVIRWNSENAGAWQPDCKIEDGYLTFRTAVSAGNTYTISVTYPNDTFGFSTERQAVSDDYGGDDDYNGNGYDGNSGSDVFYIIMGIIGLIFMLFVPVYLFAKFVQWISRGVGFGTGETKTEKKITRTKIEYFETCPGCGAPREEGKDNCPYCGRSMIKSKEVVEENQIEKPEKYRKTGTYRYGSDPNTYIRVNVINVPVSHPHSGGSHRSGGSGRSGGSRSSGGSSHRSSCASCCACASSCACVSSCACACACASSGRAGCSVKDFFKKSIHEGRIRVESRQDRSE